MKRPLIISLLVIAVGLIVWLFISEVNEPRPVDWTITYSRSDKNPYGCFVTYNLLPDLFPEKNITPIRESIKDMVHPNSYDYEEDSDYYTEQEDTYEDEYSETEEDYFDEDEYSYDDYEDPIAVEELVEEVEEIIKPLKETEIDSSVAKSNLVFISELVTINTGDGEALADLVKDGSTVFMAAYGFNIQIPVLNNLDVDQRSEGATDSTTLRFEESPLKKRGHFAFRKGSVNAYFATIPENARILTKNNYGDPTMIEVPMGKGAFYLSSTPLAFTNYNMLKPENHEFISSSLSYLNVENTYWCGNYLGFDYYLGGSGDGSSKRPEKDRSILDFIHKHPPLTWAFYLALGTILLFMIFEIKRRQRIIPIVKPHNNTSVEFTKTVSQLYLQRGNHKDIATKRVNYFLEFLRSRYHLNTNDINDDFVAKTAIKTGVDLNKTTTLFQLIKRIRKVGNIDQHQLIDLNRQIDSFKKDCNL